MYPDNLDKAFIENSSMVSCLLRKQLETKLFELYANGYRRFLDEDALLLNYDENYINQLAAVATQQKKHLSEYQQAWGIWSAMEVDDRLFLLKTFQEHFNRLKGKKSAKRNMLVFCKVFISEFVPIISTNRN